MSRLFALVLCVLPIAANADVAVAGPTKTTAKPVITKSGLKYFDIKVGTGAEAKSGMRVKVHYTGWLTSGKKFDSSVDRSEPFVFTLGNGMVIKGWDEGVAGMKIGGKRQLHIPADLGYGERGFRDLIPPGSVLIFDIELLDPEAPPPLPPSLQE
jgi:FKBP-type peptidyl-prolyl cis-trans isomerase